MYINIIDGLPRKPDAGELVGLDIEIFGMEKPLHRPSGIFACMSIAFTNGDVYMVYNTEDARRALEILDPGQWVFQNAMFDVTHLRRWMEIKPRPLHDTLLVERALYGGLYDAFGLDALARRYLRVLVDKEPQKEFIQATEMNLRLRHYAALDALLGLRVAERQEVPTVYEKIDGPAIWAFLDFQPWRVDVDNWLKRAEYYAAKGKEIEEQIGLNVKSYKKVKERLNQEGIPVQSTGAGILEPYRDHPLVAAVLEARSWRTANETYGSRWIKQNVTHGDLVFPGWNVIGADTGRTSCSEPNMQNIPVREYPEFRDDFITRLGVMQVSDVAQQEPRITAYLSQDKSLIEAFRRKEDIHQYVANEVSTDRDKGKALNLGITYGLTPNGMSDRTGLPVETCERLIRQYFHRFPGVHNYIRRTHNQALAEEKVYTAAGRVYHVNTYRRQPDWKNNSVNSPIQGGGADHTKLTLVRLWERCQIEGVPYHALGNIHDEIVVDTTPELSDWYEEATVASWLEVAEELYPGVPFEIDMQKAKSWGGGREL